MERINFNLVIIILGRLLQALLSIGMIKLMTALLAPEQVGNVYLFNSFATLFLLVFINPPSQYVCRYTHKWHDEGTLQGGLILYCLLVLIFSVIFVVFCRFFHILGWYSGLPIGAFLMLIFGYILFQGINLTFLSVLNVLDYQVSFVSLSLMVSLGSLVFCYLGIVFFDPSATFWIIGLVLGNFVVLLLLIPILKRKMLSNSIGVYELLKKISRNKIDVILKFSLPLVASTFFMWLQNSGYRIIVEKNIGLEFLGFLGVGLAVSGQIASTFESVVMQYLYPVYYKQINSDSKKDRITAINNLINMALSAYLMLAIFTTFLSKNILVLLVDEKYYQVCLFVSLGIWVEFFRMATNLVGNISKSEMNTVLFLYPYILGGLSTVSIVFFVSMCGFDGYYILLGLILGSIITVFFMYKFMYRLLPFKIDYSLLLYAFLLSGPYGIVYFLDLNFNSAYMALLIVVLFGLYFLMALYVHYKKIQQYGYR